MLLQTYGDRRNPAVLFFHAMGVTGSSSEPIARYLQDRYFCILPTSTVYCEGQKYVSKLDEIRQVEDFLHRQGVERLAMVVASSIGADLAMAFLTQTKLPVEHAFFDGGQFAQIGKGTRRIMTPFLYFAIKSLCFTFLPTRMVPTFSLKRGSLRIEKASEAGIPSTSSKISFPFASTPSPFAISERLILMPVRPIALANEGTFVYACPFKPIEAISYTACIISMR